MTAIPTHVSRWGSVRSRVIALSSLVALAACSGSALRTGPLAESSGGGHSTQYYVYVGAESADLMHRIRFGPDGATIDRTTPVGESGVETEGPHGFASSPDGQFVYMTTGHGFPDGKLWKYHAGPDTLVGDGVLLGWFPATIDLTPDGLYAFVANFNLHGDPVPSSVSVVYTPDMVEVEQIETCVMPHGARMAPDGIFLYSNCMMDDQLVEIDTRTFEVSRRFFLGEGREGPVTEWPAAVQPGESGMRRATCSPTWAQPTLDGASVLVACNRGNYMLEVDRRTWSASRRIETGAGPYNLAVTPDGKTLVATLKQAGAVELFDLESGRSLGRLESSTALPHGVTVSPDSRYAFVSVEGIGAEPGKVDVFDLATRSRVADVAVGQQAGGITFWHGAPRP